MGEEATTYEDVSKITIEEYLRNVTAYDIPDGTIANILLRRGANWGTLVADMSDKDVDLCTADLYMWAASTPSSKNDTEDASGNWKHKEGGWQTSAYDKRQLRQMAQELYSKWDETPGARSKMSIISF